jgi:hypothetical protein
MPTPQWFQENPKVSTYIPRELHNALEAWMKERQIKKVSQALIKILETQLGFSNDVQGESFAQYATIDQLEELRNEIKSLSEKLDSSKPEEPKKTTSQVDQLELIEEKPSEKFAGVNSEWMTSREACELYGNGIKYETFRKYQPEKLMSTFGLEADITRKQPGKGTGKWLRQI